MVMVILPPERLNHLLGRFRNVLSKPQFENFRSVMFGLIISSYKEHDVKSMKDIVGETKCQSSINRFFTSPSWNLDDVMKCAHEIIFSTVRHDHNLEFLIIDDTVCKKYGIQSEMVCYNHSTVLGTVLSHDYVTAFYLCGDICLPSSARLYGNPKKCNEKDIPFRTKIQLCNEIIDEHRPISKKTVILIDSWYTGNEVISNCRKRGYHWIGDLKPNRVILYDGKRMHVSDLMNILRKEGQFTDTIIDDGQIYQTMKVMAYIPSLKENVSIVINAKADTNDIHVLCTDLQQEDISTIISYARKRVTIENSYKDAKQLGFGEYRFRKSEAALIHAHLVFLAYILLQILRYRLLSYKITKAVPSMEFVITWIRKKTRQRFIHYIGKKLKQGTSIRSLIMTIGRIDTVYV
jgi:DDE superfamily endonuclease